MKKFKKNLKKFLTFKLKCNIIKLIKEVIHVKSVLISLRGARVDAKLTIREVAEKLDVNESTVANWETGKTTISAKHLSMLSDLYGRKMDDFLLPKYSS